MLLNTMNHFFDENILELIDGIKDLLPNGLFIGIAKNICAVLALLYFAIKAYGMMLGEGRLEIMPLFRPFVIVLVIVNWGLFTSTVAIPGNGSSNIAKNQFQAMAELADKHLDEKAALTDQLWTKLLENTNSMEEDLAKKNAAASSSDNIALQALEAAGLSLGKIQAKITVLEQMMFAKIKMMFQDMILWVAMAVFKGIMYCIFFVQMLLMHILLILGPISFALSMIGSFRDAWVAWVSRFISVTFYSTVGFIVLHICLAIIDYGLQQEISRLTYIVDGAMSVEQFMAAVLHIDNFIGYLLVAIVVCTAGTVMVPVVTTWIVQTSGSGNTLFMAPFRAAGTGAAMATKAASQTAKAVL